VARPHHATPVGSPSRAAATEERSPLIPPLSQPAPPPGRREDRTDAVPPGRHCVEDLSQGAGSALRRARSGSVLRLVRAGGALRRAGGAGRQALRPVGRTPGHRHADCAAADDEAVTAPGRISRRSALTSLTLAGIAGLWGATGDSFVPAYPAGDLRVATGPRGGVYAAYGQGVVAVVRDRLPRLRPAALITQASVQNLRMLAAHRAEVAFSLADAAAAARAGQPPFTGPLDVMALARLYDNCMHLVVRADGPVRTVADLAGRRVAIGSPGSGTELLTLRLLRVAGLDPDRDLTAERINVDVAAPALRERRVDAFFFSGGIPVTAIAGLRVPLRLVDLGRLVPGMRQFGEFYSERTIPGRPYRLGYSTATVGEPNFLMVAADMDERVAYQVTRALFAGRDRLARAHPEGRRLDRAAAIATCPLPLHPGAVRFYREVKR
jgi:TRAP transporter TAXI family solute receptor